MILSIICYEYFCHENFASLAVKHPDRMFYFYRYMNFESLMKYCDLYLATPEDFITAVKLKCLLFFVVHKPYAFDVNKPQGTKLSLSLLIGSLQSHPSHWCTDFPKFSADPQSLNELIKQIRRKQTRHISILHLSLVCFGIQKMRPCGACAEGSRSPLLLLC